MEQGRFERAVTSTHELGHGQALSRRRSVLRRKMAFLHHSKRFWAFLVCQFASSDKIGCAGLCRFGVRTSFEGKEEIWFGQILKICRFSEPASPTIIQGPGVRRQKYPLKHQVDMQLDQVQAMQTDVLRRHREGQNELRGNASMK